jgi:hypothetical protein
MEKSIQKNEAPYPKVSTFALTGRGVEGGAGANEQERQWNWWRRVVTGRRLLSFFWLGFQIIIFSKNKPVATHRYCKM